MVLDQALGIYAGTLAIGVASCFVPVVSIEVFLVGLTLARGPADAALIIALATLGQVIGKLPVYFALSPRTPVHVNELMLSYQLFPRDPNRPMPVPAKEAN